MLATAQTDVSCLECGQTCRWQLDYTQGSGNTRAYITHRRTWRERTLLKSSAGRAWTNSILRKKFACRPGQTLLLGALDSVPS
jgi:hypothetical protein